MGRRNHILGLVFLMVVLGFSVFAAKRLLFHPSPASSRVAALLEKAKPAAKPTQPKPSPAVPAQTSPSQTSPAPVTATPSAAAPPASGGQAQVSAPPAGQTVASAKNDPPSGVKNPAPATEDRRTEDRHTEDHPADRRSEDRRPEVHLPADPRPQLRIGSGVRLWIHVTGINRKPDGSFTFRGTLLQPVALADTSRLDQDTELAGSGTVNHGHVTVLVKEFTVAGTDYALQDAGGSNRRSGTGLAVELDPGKLLEVWLASSSVYRKAP
jgi:hypothetical protein